MEEEMKGKKSNVSVVLLIIALIVIVVMGVFMFKLLNDKKVATDEVAKLNNQVSTLQSTVNNLQGTIDNVSDPISDSKSETTYKSYIDALKDSLKKINKQNTNEDENKIEFTYKVDSNVLSSLSLKDNGDLYAYLLKDSNLGKKYGTTYKMSSNVVKVFVTSHKTGDFAGKIEISIIKEDGKLYNCTINEEKNFENIIEFNDTGLKNIVDIEMMNNGEANIPIAIDTDGNTFLMNNEGKFYSYPQAENTKEINCNISIGNVDVSAESTGNTRIHVNGTINLSFDKNKYEGIMLSGYCLGSNGEKYLMHGPGDGRTLYSNNGDNDTVLSLTENIPQDIKYSDGTVKGWSEIDWNNVKIKYCKIDKLEAVLKDGSSVEMELNYEKNF